ncbi:MAG: hypothetical protein RRA92_06055 [Gemmatimonadota bacterium]|nr:hypothetical protein [Gemmatimonadota bacterium]
MNVHRRVLGPVLGLIFLSPLPLLAQGYSGELRVRADVVGFQGLERDSLAESAVPGSGLQRRLPDGTIVTCLEGDFCRWFGSIDDTETITPVYQDLRLTAWPGIQGLSLHTQLRGRVASDDGWPRGGEEIEAITAYVSYQQSGLRARAGRIVRSSPLGYRNFDGGSLTWAGLGPVRVEAYGGWGLGPGLDAPRDGDLLADVDEFAPDDRALIYGFEAGLDVARTFFASGFYQREIRSDRAALHSERVGGTLRALVGPATLDGSATYDLIGEEFNDIRFQASSPIAGGFGLLLEGRHYLPFFEYWTIWSAFDPVAFNEGRGLLTWTHAGSGLTLEVGGGYRDYDETEAGVEFADIESDGWRLYGGGRWSRGPWFVDGGYRSETTFGAARYGGDLTVGRRFDDAGRVALFFNSTKTFGEFRIGEQVGTGGGVDASWNVGALTFSGAAALYRLTYDNRPSVEDWTQPRAHLSIAWRFGSRPAPRTSMRGIGGY